MYSYSLLCLLSYSLFSLLCFALLCECVRDCVCVCVCIFCLLCDGSAYYMFMLFKPLFHILLFITTLITTMVAAQWRLIFC